MRLGQGLGITQSGTVGGIILPSTYFWYDASDASTVIIDAGKVTDWLDKSSNSFDLSQSSVSNQPTYAASGIVCDGSDISLQRTQALGMTSMTIFAVFETIATAAFNNTIIEQGNDGANWSFKAGAAVTGNLGEFTTKIGGVNDARRTGALTPGTRYMMSAFYDETTGNKRIYLNDTLTSSTTLSGPIDTDQTLLQVGSRNGATTKIIINEIMGFNYSLGETDANNVGNFLSGKWLTTFDGTFDGTFA